MMARRENKDQNDDHARNLKRQAGPEFLLFGIAHRGPTLWVVVLHHFALVPNVLLAATADNRVDDSQEDKHWDGQK